MNSGGHRGFTVVTIITLVFAPFFNHHQWLWRLVGETKTTNVVQCAPAQPCPQHKVIVQTVQQPIPPGGGDTGNGNGNGNGNGRRQPGSRHQRQEGQALTPLMLVVSAVLVAFDFQNLLSWWHGRLLKPVEHGTSDYTIVVPLFGHPRYFDGRSQIERYRDNVLVALEVTPPHMQTFADELEAEGWHVCRVHLNRPNPASLMREALGAVTTTYALRLDADTHLDDGLDRIVAAFAASGADLCSVKVEADRPQTTAEKLQALEYRMAMLARHYRPWMTSGACFIGKTESLRLIFAHHSLWTPGEDVETGRAAHALRLKIRHADFVVTTEVPATWRALVKQRRLWWAGTFRHNFVNADRNLVHLPVLTCYMLLAVYATIEFKWWGMLDWGALPTELPLVLVVYVFVTFISNIQVRSRWMIVFPIYALAQSLVMPIVGALYYFVLAKRAGRAGRYRVGYRRGLPRRSEAALAVARIERAAQAVAAARQS